MYQRQQEPKTKKVRNWKKKGTRKHQPRFGQYLKKVEEEIQEKQTQIEIRCQLTSLLKNYAKKRQVEYWCDLVDNVLPKMKQELIELGDVPVVIKAIDVIQYSIKFMDIVSHYQDSFERRRINFAPPSKESVCDQFNGSVYLAGRHTPYERLSRKGVEVPYWNQSKFGETVTEKNVFFGPDVYLRQMPASYWLTLPKMKKNKISLMIAQDPDGRLVKESPKMWMTDAIVKYGGVRSFCAYVRKNLIDCIDLMTD